MLTGWEPKDPRPALIGSGVLLHPPIRRHQEFWWRDSGLPTNDVAEKRIPGREHIPGEVDRIAAVHREILPDGGEGGCLVSVPGPGLKLVEAGPQR
jgi:hypothetical protein